MGADERLLRQLLSHVQTVALLFDLEEGAERARLVYANEAARRVLGKDPVECTGRLLSELLPGQSCEPLGGSAGDGRERELVVTVDGEPERARCVSLARNMVALIFEAHSRQLIKAEAEARRAQRFLDSIIEQVPAMIFMKDAEQLRFERFNRAGEELLGLSREQLLGKNDYDLFPGEQADFFVAKDRQVLESGALLDISEEPIQTPRGQRWLHTRKIGLRDEAGVPRHLLGISLDVTERKQAAELLRDDNDALLASVAERTRELEQEVDERRRTEQALLRTEEQLRQSQKMEAIGRLAGGIAHDFNNMLSVVLGYCDLSLSLVDEREPLSEMVHEIQRAGLRAAELTRRLLAFSRQQVLRPRSLNLNEVVAALEGMLTRLLSEDIEFRVLLSRDMEKVLADPHQIEQVIMNLVVNARDAMPDGGKLLIETGLVELDEAFVRGHLGACAGLHALLAVTDTGVGMDADLRSRIFEPFFTTKETGKGTGLGLSTVLGIVQQSEGSIWVYSELGHGTTFKIYLPIRQGGEAEVVRFDKSIAPNSAGGETVLLVEDDEQLRVLASEILRQRGFQVLEAKNGRHAHEVHRAHKGEIQVLLTDVVMPEKGGRLLAEELLREQPGLRVLFMSGYTDDAVVHHGIERGMSFVQKPFTPAALVRAVRAVLDAGR
jgi:two-component system cell cycle sensor histidine kinase/response regulator CckA